MSLFRNLKTQKDYRMSDSLNFLWRQEKRPFYIMDNHLAALWCWLQELDPEDSYSLVHIDAHWDVGNPYLDDNAINELQEARTIEAFLAVRDPHSRAAKGWPAIRWNNFIMPLPLMRPGLERGIFLGRELETECEFMQDKRIEVWHPDGFWDDFASGEMSRLKGRRLIDIDVDYFYGRVGGGWHQIFSDDFIIALLGDINSRLRPNDIVTIALSPDCCGGIENSIKMCQLVCEMFNITIPNELRNRLS